MNKLKSNIYISSPKKQKIKKKTPVLDANKDQDLFPSNKEEDKDILINSPKEISKITKIFNLLKKEVKKIGLELISYKRDLKRMSDESRIHMEESVSFNQKGFYEEFMKKNIIENIPISTKLIENENKYYLDPIREEKLNELKKLLPQENQIIGHTEVSDLFINLICLDENKKIKTRNFKEKIVLDYINKLKLNKPVLIPKEWKNEPIIIIFTIKNLLKRYLFKEAAFLFLKERDKLGIKNQIFRQFVTKIQIILTKHVFNEQLFHLLEEFLSIVFLSKEEKGYEKLFFIQGIIAFVINNENYFLFKMNSLLEFSESKYRDGAAFFLGIFYKEKGNIELSNRAFRTGTLGKQSFWHLMCKMYLQETPNMISLDKLKPNTDRDPNYIFLERAYNHCLKKNYMDAINNIHSFFIRKRIGICDLCIKLIKKIREVAPISVQFRFGDLLLKKTGIIISDFFPIPSYIRSLSDYKDNPIYWMTLLTSHVAVETKFIDLSSKYLISNRGAKGAIQILSNVAKEICKRKKLPFYPEKLTSDHAYNLKIGKELIKSNLKECNSNLLLAISYYNGGFLPVGRARKFTFFDLKKIHNVLIFNLMIISRENEEYVPKVLEYMIIYYFLLTKEPLTPEIIRDIEIQFSQKNEN